MTDNGNTKKFFSGQYVEPIRDALIASALSGVNALLIGGAGTGKTAISSSMADDIFGRKVIIRLDETTPPEKITGPIDLGKMLAEDSKLEFVRENTPYEPGLMNCILDEVGRASGPIFSLLMDVTDRLDMPESQRYAVWCTSNFMPSGDKTAALLDRIGFWVWVPTAEQDVTAFIRARAASLHEDLHVPGTLPTRDDVIAAYAAVPGPKAIQAIANFIQTLADEVKQDASGFKFMINNRRMSQWFSILFRAGYWYSGGDPDFDIIPDKAILALKWAYPNTSLEMSVAWEQIVTPLADSIGAMVDQIFQTAYGQFKTFCANYPTKSARIGKIGELGAAIQTAQQNLYSVADSENERVQDALNRLTEVYSAILSGDNPML